MLLDALFGLGASTAVYASLDSSAWRAYETVEEAWIRDRHELLVQQAPQAQAAAEVDLAVRLADLRKRAIEFRYLATHDQTFLRGGVWQMTSLPLTPACLRELNTQPEYRRQQERIRQLTETLRRHPQFTALQKAQMRLWKTPQYREIHRRYTGRMQDLQRTWGGGASIPSLSMAEEQ